MGRYAVAAAEQSRRFGGFQGRYDIGRRAGLGWIIGGIGDWVFEAIVQEVGFILGCLDGFAVNLVRRNAIIVGHHPLAALVGEHGRLHPAENVAIAGEVVVGRVHHRHTYTSPAGNYTEQKKKNNVKIPMKR